MKEYKANIIINNIEVDDRYFSFDYVIEIKDVCTIKNNYESDYCNGQTKDEWKKYLEESDYCLNLALEQVAGEL